MEPLFARLAAIASRQHALITLAQLTELGVSRHQRERLVAKAHLCRVAPRVWLVGGAPFPGRLGHWPRLSRPLPTRSSRTAPRPPPSDWTGSIRFDSCTSPCPAGGRSVSTGRTYGAHYSFDFDLIRPTKRNLIPVTDAARLVLDLYACEPNPEVARRRLFSARKKKLVSWTELSDCLEAHARHGRRGITRLRADLDLYSRIGCPETTFEDVIRKLLMEAGLPEPKLQYRVTAGGRRYRIDVAYPEFKIGVEGKSKEHHLTDQAFESDSVRDADLAIAGWIIIHVTWAQIRDDPPGVIRRIERALSRREGVAA